VSIRFPSLCSIEKRPSLGPDLPPGRAPRGAAVRDAAANAADAGINPIGEIPTVVFDDARILSESGAIL